MIFSWLKTVCFCALVLYAGTSVKSVNGGDVSVELIEFDDLTAGLSMKMQWCWNAIGMDPNGNLYVMFGGPEGDHSNCALFQYQSKTGERKFLGTAVEALKASNNWLPGERVEKGHTHLPYLNEKIYIGTMGFHDATGSKASKRMQFALNSRGAHMLSYDPTTGRIEDLSHDQPKGVFFSGRGFMAMTAMASHNLVIGFTVPHGDLLLYNVVKQHVHAIVPGIEEEFGKRVSREVVAANGKIYYAYFSVDNDSSPGHMYIYDVDAGRLRDKPLEIDPWFWNGQTKSRDGQQVYLSSQSGNLYRLNTETDSLERLGNLIPEADRIGGENDQYTLDPPQILGITLSDDERRIYAADVRRVSPRPPEQRADGSQIHYREPLGLCEYNLRTKQFTRVHRFDRWSEDEVAGVSTPFRSKFAWPTGSDSRDKQGNVYFAVHGTKWGILKFNVSSRERTEE